MLLFTALRFPALIPALSESQFSCEMLYCFICGFQLSPSCLHPETLLSTCLSFFFFIFLTLSSEVSARRAAHSHLPHVLICSALPSPTGTTCCL